MNKERHGEAVSEAIPEYKQAPGGRYFEEGRRYTYSDYCTWNDYDAEGRYIRYELYEGIPVVMDSPGRKHQKILLEIAGQLRDFLKGKPCEVYIAAFDVRLNADDADDTVVQPDILVVCDESKLSDKSCNGAPDLVIEILSPGSARYDKLTKMLLYEKYGVREYWIVDPDEERITVHLPIDGKFYLRAFEKTDRIPVHTLPGCVIDLTEVFEQ